MKTRIHPLIWAIVLGSLSVARAGAQEKQAPKTPPAKPDAPARQTTPPKSDPAAPPPPGNGNPLASPLAPGKPVDQGLISVKPTASDLDNLGFRLSQQNKMEEAIKAFRQAVELDKNDIRGLVGLADSYAATQRYYESAETYQKIISLRPTIGQFQFGLGTALLNLDRTEEARSAFSRAIELGPNDPGNLSYRLGIGQSFLREGEYVRARNAFLNALGYAPDNPTVHAALGEAYSHEKRYADALDEFDVALRITKDYSPALTGAADALSNLGRAAEAEKRMRAWVERAPKSPEPIQGLAQALEAAGKRDDAIVQYKTALAMAPEDPYLWGNLGWTQYGAGRYEEAVASSRKALTYDNKLPYVRFNLGLIYAVQNHWAEAQKEYVEAARVATLPDLQSGLNDVQDALAKPSTQPALHQAADFLTSEIIKRTRKPQAGGVP